MGKKKLLYLFRFFVISVLIGFVAIYRKQIAQILPLLKAQASLSFLMMIGGITLISFVNEPFRWKLLLDSHNLSFKKLYLFSTATAAISYSIPARMGIPARLILSKLVLSLPVSTTGVIFAVDSFLLYLSWFITALIGTLVSIRYAGSIPIVAIVLLAFSILFIFIIVKLELHKKIDLLEKVYATIKEGLEKISGRAVVFNLILLVFDIVIYGIRHWVILAMFDIHISLVVVIFIVAISISAGFVSLMPLGFGGYDVTLFLLLTSYGVDESVALSLPIINRIFMISIGILLGFISLNILGFKKEDYLPDDTYGNK